jgi:beta-lactamase class A
MPISRRLFAFNALVAGAGAALRKSAAAQAIAAVSSPSPKSAFVIRYPSAPDAASCLDQRRLVGEQLGSQVEQQLKLVLDSKGQYALVWDGNLSDAALDQILKTQDAALKKAGVGSAEKVSASTFRDVFDVRYGKAEKKLEDAKKLYTDIYRVLGPSVGKELVIQRDTAGLYSVVFRGLCDEAACDFTLSGQQEKLDELDVDAELIPEQDQELVYGESSYLAEHDDLTELLALPPPDLVPGLQEAVKAMMAKACGPGETAAVLVTDVVSGRVLMHLNETRPMECASMVKPLVALAYFHRCLIEKAPGFVYDDAVREDLQRMIQDSDNAATNRFFLRIGGATDPNALLISRSRRAERDETLSRGAAKIQNLLQANYGDLFPQTKIVEAIPDEGKAYANRASVQDYAQLMLGLYHRRLPGSAEILRVMALPKKHPNRVYDGVPEIPRGTLCYDKTGTTAQDVGNFAILSPLTEDGHRRPYFIAMVVDRPTSVLRREKVWSHKLAMAMRQVSSFVFQQLTPVYHFKKEPPPPLPPVNRKLRPGHHRAHSSHSHPKSFVHNR